MFYVQFSKAPQRSLNGWVAERCQSATPGLQRDLAWPALCWMLFLIGAQHVTLEDFSSQ